MVKLELIVSFVIFDRFIFFYFFVKVYDRSIFVEIFCYMILVVEGLLKMFFNCVI